MTSSPWAQVWRDGRWWLMVAAAPAVWLVLWWIGGAHVAGSRDDMDVPGWLLIVLVSPAVEEIVFRGIIQPFLQRSGAPFSLGPLTLANLITSLLFCALHLLRHPPLWAASVFFPSLVFGYARERYGRLAPSIVLHVFYNAGFFWIFS